MLFPWKLGSNPWAWNKTRIKKTRFGQIFGKIVGQIFGRIFWLVSAATETDEIGKTAAECFPGDRFWGKSPLAPIIEKSSGGPPLVFINRVAPVKNKRCN